MVLWFERWKFKTKVRSNYSSNLFFIIICLFLKILEETIFQDMTKTTFEEVHANFIRNFRANMTEIKSGILSTFKWFLYFALYLGLFIYIRLYIYIILNIKIVTWSHLHLHQNQWLWRCPRLCSWCVTARHFFPIM